MRFEAKNKYFKGLASQIGNYINIPLTLATRHQQLQCYNTLTTDHIGKELEIGPGDSVSTEVICRLGLNVSVEQNPCRYVQTIAS